MFSAWRTEKQKCDTAHTERRETEQQQKKEMKKIQRELRTYEMQSRIDRREAAKNRTDRSFVHVKQKMCVFVCMWVRAEKLCIKKRIDRKERREKLK